jgi:thiol-disulfide isomerase/thioredoxin
MVFEVVSADPIVEVEPIHGPPTLRLPFGTRPRYLRPQSRSARIAALLEEELALAHACRAIPTGSCGSVSVLPDPNRVVPGHDVMAAVDRLRAVVPSADETLATWAYFNVGCPQASDDEELANAALRKPIDPIARNLWPVGIARAVLAAEGPAGAELRLSSMQGDADRHVAAAMLVELFHEARGRHDLERAGVMRERLQRTPGPWTGSPLAARLNADRRIVGVQVGSIPLRTLTGEVRDPVDLKGHPILLYTAASWCKPCQDTLPELRSLAEKYPELVVLYAMFDDAEAAAAYARDHAPIPGTVVVAGEAERKTVEVLLGSPAFPSFVVIGRDGRVAALPAEDDLETVVRRSNVMAGS